MKTLIFTLLLSFCTLLSMASTDYAPNTYTVLGETKTFTNKVNLGLVNMVYDCYTENGNNLATAVFFNHPSGGLHHEELLDEIFQMPSEVTYNGKTYTVTKIADRAFDNSNPDLSWRIVNIITIPNTVEVIGDKAFYNNPQIHRLEMGDGVLTIGEQAFENCSLLSYVEMGKNVTYIGWGAFTACTSLGSIILPSSLSNMGQYVFQACKRLKVVEWDIDTNLWNSENLMSKYPSLPPGAVLHTKTRKQADIAEASHVFYNVYSDEDKTYIESLKKTISDKDKTIADNNTMAENLASQYTMMQQESQVLQVHNNKLNDCDVNQDGLVNSTDVVTVYNRIIQGGTSSYNGQSYVDLGLPSGTLWATCNVGAPSPECVGDYFAWGENGFYSYRYGLAFGKLEFTEKTYVPAPGVEDIVNGEWPQEYSPLKVIYIAQWDGWKIPTYDQARELTNNCTKEVVTINGQECLELTSKVNKRKIYFPLNGKIDGTFAKETNEVCYWTSSTGSSKYYAYIIPFRLHSIYLTEDRYLGMGIRPVITKEDIEK